MGGGGRLGKEAGVGFGAPKRQMTQPRGRVPEVQTIQLMTASGRVGTAGALGAVPVTSRSSVDTPGPAEAAPGAGGGRLGCSGLLREGLSQAGGLAVLAQWGLCFLMGGWMPSSPLFLLSSLSVESCPGMGARTLLSRPGAGGSTFLSQEEGSVVVKS